MDEFLIFQRHGCETRYARLAAVLLKNEIDLGRWHAINMAPLRGFIGQTQKQDSKENGRCAPKGVRADSVLAFEEVVLDSFCLREQERRSQIKHPLTKLRLVTSAATSA